jgi:hypothetical protein
MFNNILYWLYVNLPQYWGWVRRHRSKLAMIDCPYNEPLHFHHDGCPSCTSMDFD